jgi:hypothetical protein
MAAIRDAFGSIPARSRLKSGGDFRLRAYRAWKTQILQTQKKGAGDI